MAYNVYNEYDDSGGDGGCVKFQNPYLLVISFLCSAVSFVVPRWMYLVDTSESGFLYPGNNSSLVLGLLYSNGGGGGSWVVDVFEFFLFIGMSLLTSVVVVVVVLVVVEFECVVVKV